MVDISRGTRDRRSVGVREAVTWSQFDTADSLPSWSLLVVESTLLFREALATRLRDLSWTRSVETAGSVADAMLYFAEARSTPDVTLLSMQSPRAPELVWALREADIDTKVVAIAVPETEDDIVACVELGVAGMLPVGGGMDDLELILIHVLRGQTMCSPVVGAALFNRLAMRASQKSTASRGESVDGHLTSRERQVLQLIERGLSNKDIARELSIEVRTVKNHVHSILEKLRVTRRGEAAALLRSAGAPSAEALSHDGGRMSQIVWS